MQELGGGIGTADLADPVGNLLGLVENPQFALPTTQRQPQAGPPARVDSTERDHIRSSPSPVILSLDCVTAGPRAHPALEDVSWHLRKGELWAIVGPNGAGKSSLLGVLRGRIPVTRGALRYGPDERGRALAADPVGQIVSVSFGSQVALLKGTAGYTQSRWHGGHDDAVARGRDVLGSALNLVECRRVIDALALHPLLDRRVSELSNGERRKLALARSAGRRPAVLALDNPFNGLDGIARRAVSDTIEELHRDGMTLLVSTAREDEIPQAVTHVLLLDRGRVVICGPRRAVLTDDRFLAVMRPRARTVSPSANASILRPARLRKPPAPVVVLRDVNVTYGRTRVLREVSWTVRRGERWLVVGPNGAGKSALLGLILADNPQAYANDVSLFGRRRGSGDTIWEIRRRIGSVSPETHLYEELDRRVLDVIASGLHDPADPWRPSTASELRTAEELVGALELEGRRDHRLHELSEGERQMALLGRAMANDSELLVLDEPCQGLDASRRALFLDLLERRLDGTDTTLIYVTHDLDEIPSIVQHGLLVRGGRSVLEGSAAEILTAYSGERRPLVDG